MKIRAALAPMVVGGNHHPPNWQTIHTDVIMPIAPDGGTLS